MNEEKLKNCHTEEGQSPDVSISTESSLSYVRESARQDIVLSGSELDISFNLPPLNPLLARRGKEKEEFLSRRGIVWIFCCLFSFNAHATCTPTPDCASIGYTETFCETKSVKCPFDTSKLFCIPCDSSFQHTCNANYMIKGIGNSCNNKYVSCECVSGAVFKNDECVCDRSCKMGNIYYADGTCSSCLETNKNIAGIIVKDNEIIMSKPVRMAWGGQGTDVGGLPNTPQANASSDMNGKSNTLAIVSAFGESATSIYAGVYCNAYAPIGLENTKGQWYFPSAGELYAHTYPNYSDLAQTVGRISWDYFTNYWFWSSTEDTSTSAWTVYPPTGNIAWNGKNDTGSITCFYKL